MYTQTEATAQNAVYTLQSKADLHLHTTHSDGGATVAVLLEHVASKTNLRVIAITDHDTIDGAIEAQRLAASFGIEVIMGEEVSTADGHLLALFIERSLPPGQPATQTIAAIHEQGGLAITAHPYDWMVPSMGRRGLRQHSGQSQPEWHLDGIESFNAGVLLPNMNAQAVRTAATLGLPTIGGSDSHQLATVGYGYTLFPGQTAAELRTAILHRRVQAGGRFWGWRATLEVTGHVLISALRRLQQRRLGTRPSTSTWPANTPYTITPHKNIVSQRMDSLELD